MDREISLFIGLEGRLFGIVTKIDFYLLLILEYEIFYLNCDFPNSSIKKEK